LVVLSIAYGVVIVAGLVGLPNLHGGLLAVAHLVSLVVLLIASMRVDVTQRPSIARFYLLVWGLFYAEYVVFPAAGLMA